ncbi:MAG TPA: manganese efflux pump MntP family protein [Elusimicrobiota bacterium]|nr:manganese efflux pump MntP family protein [Elusimicrobiota bacterium]
MDLLTTLLIAIGLSMDAFAVAVASGIALNNLKTKDALTIATSFGLFQAVMPVLGWWTGLSLRQFISGIDHWIAFGLLSAIGVKMIYEATRLDDDEKPMSSLRFRVLLLLAIATSIDALAVGLSFAFLHVPIIAPSLIIGAVTFVLSFAGVYLGRRVGHLFENKIEILGGLILIGIGLKILLQHLGTP